MALLRLKLLAEGDPAISTLSKETDRSLLGGQCNSIHRCLCVIFLVFLIILAPHTS